MVAVLVTKNTFVEFVETSVSDRVRPSLRRARTESLAVRSVTDSDVESVSSLSNMSALSRMSADSDVSDSCTMKSISAEVAIKLSACDSVSPINIISPGTPVMDFMQKPVPSPSTVSTMCPDFTMSTMATPRSMVSQMSSPICMSPIMVPMPPPCPPSPAAPWGASAKPQRLTTCSTMESEDGDAKTTVIMKNIPNKYSQRMLLNKLRQEGFDRTFDFLHAPIDFKNKCNIGFAFINFISHKYAVEFMEVFSGMQLPICNSQKRLEVEFAKSQGVPAHMEKLANTAVMESYVAPEFQPLMFDPETGRDLPFPTMENTAHHRVTSRRETDGADAPCRYCSSCSLQG